MTAVVRVAMAVTGDDEPALVAGLGEHPGVEVVRRCADLADLLACSASGLAQAVVVSADQRGLDAEAFDRLRLDGSACVVLATAGDPSDLVRLRRLGLDHVLAAGTAPADVAGALLSACRAATPPASAATPAHRSAPVIGASARADPVTPPRVGRPRSDRLTLGHSEPRAALPQPVPPADHDPLATGAGRVAVVWGPTGAPGRTTLAIGLAAELAGSGHPTVLVDADTYGASVAQCLGLLDESSGLATAARAADRGSLDLPTLSRLAPLVADRLRVLTGTTRADRWPELRAGSVSAVLELTRSLATWTVVDVGFCLEQDEELSFDTAAPRRNAATLAALAAADVVLAVGSSDPVGLQRLVRGLDELKQVCQGPPIVVVNRLRSGPVGSNPGRRVRDALRRYADVRDVVLVANDPASMDAALLTGRTLAEQCRSSPVRQSLQDLVVRVTADRGVPALA
ncbi:AAA family ATPase [Angustibacter sp. McL0619]|uniref:AAA family ATPase n=1 Tax=Angustibacter sp. McL0619 TaxID=3415676 RepID=UPI003CED083E